MVPRVTWPGVRLRAKDNSAALRQNLFRLVRRAVIDHDRLELRRFLLLTKCVENALQHRDAVMRRNDH